PAADTVTALIRSGKIRRLLIQEWLNPATGQPADRDPRKRQILELLPGNDGAATMQDPVTTEFFVRVRWRDQDALAVNSCFTILGPLKVENVSLFHGNLIDVFHGEPRHVEFDDPAAPIPAGAFAYRRDDPHGTICRLPAEPVEYRETPQGGDTPPQSTITLRVQTTSGIEVWEERADLIHSDDSAHHFCLETDEHTYSQIVFGDGTNGMKLPDLARVLADYQSGFGLDGNIGPDNLTRLASPPPLLTGATCWNPLDAANGRAPESVDKILRRAPEMFRFRQLRAVTLADYV